MAPSFRNHRVADEKADEPEQVVGHVVSMQVVDHKTDAVPGHQIVQQTPDLFIIEMMQEKRSHRYIKFLFRNALRSAHPFSRTGSG